MEISPCRALAWSDAPYWAWHLGAPPDRAAAVALVRHVVEAGVRFIDTADSYGPYVSEEIIAEALYPYAADVVIATKAGFVRTGPDQWTIDARPARLRECAEGSLRRLKRDCIDLFHLHRIDPRVAAQVALAWLLARSPAILPIPGTLSTAHFDENLAAAHLVLSDSEPETLR